MRALRKYRQPILAGAVFLICLVVFASFWQLEVRSAAQKSRSVYLNDIQDAATGPIAQGQTVEQLFTSDKPFHALGVVPVFAGEAPVGKLHAKVFSTSGQLLAEAEGNAAQTLSGSYAFFVFPHEVKTPDGLYQLSFSAELEQAVDFSLASSVAAPDGWQLAVDGRPQAGALCLSAAVDAIGSFISVFYAVFALVASLAAALLCWLALRKKIVIHQLFAVAAAFLGLLFFMILPPYSSPDEQFHINQSFNMSSQLMGQAPRDLPWGTNVRRAGDTNPLIEDQYTTVFTYREIAREFFTSAPTREPAVFFGEDVGGYRLPYWPSAFAITLARLVGLGFVPALYMGRLVNLMLYIVLCSFAIKLAPGGKSIFAVVALLPMSLHLAASFSRDALTLGLYFFFTALCLRYIVEKPKLDWRQLVPLALLVVVAAPAKVVYVPLLLLCLLIPADVFYWQGKAMGKQLSLAVRCGIVALGMVSFFVQGGGQLLKNTLASPQPPAEASSVVAKAMPAAPQEVTVGLSAALAGDEPLLPTSAETSSENPDLNTFGLADFFRQPGTMLMLLVRTFFKDITFVLQTMVGGNLSYFSLPLNWGFVILLTGVLAVAALPGPGGLRLDKKTATISGLAVLAACGLVVLGCITWTPTYYATIYGIQGRYFLPLLPLGLVVLSSAQKAVQQNRNLEYELLFGVSITTIFALLNAFLLVLAR